MEDARQPSTPGWWSKRCRPLHDQHPRFLDPGAVSIGLRFWLLGTYGRLRTLAGCGASDVGGGSLLPGAARNVWGLAKFAGPLPASEMICKPAEISAAYLGLPRYLKARTSLSALFLGHQTLPHRLANSHHTVSRRWAPACQKVVAGRWRDRPRHDEWSAGSGTRYVAIRCHCREVIAVGGDGQAAAIAGLLRGRAHSRVGDFFSAVGLMAEIRPSPDLGADGPR